jgi:thiol:disulfide interchange protein DsbA
VKLIYTLPLLLLLAACEPKSTTDPDKETEPAKTPIAESSEKETSNPKSAEPANEAFSLLVDTPYDIVESDIACEAPVVIEFFAYQCPHCYTLEKHAEEWRAKNNGKVNFLSIPTHLGRAEFGAFLLIHEAASVMGILDKVRPALFKRIHDEKRGFASQEEAIDLLVANGAIRDVAVTTLANEESIKGALDSNFKLLAKYKIAGVPTILVNHKYQFDVTKAGGYEKVFEVVEQTLKLPSNCNK